MKERIHMINEVAQENFEKATGMLDMFNDIYGVEFFLLNKRVCYKTGYHFHDAWANM